MPRILFVHSRRASFVRIDREALAERWEVEDWYQPGRFANPLRVLAAVRRSDLVFGWFASWHTFWPMTLAWLLRRPSVLVIGGFDTACEPEIGYGFQQGGPQRRLSRWVMRRAGRLVTNSHASRGEIARTIGGSTADRVEVIHHGVPDPFGDDVLSGARDRLALSVGVVGRQSLERKGHRAFVEAARELPDVELVLAGKWDDDAARELDAAAGPNVRLTGWVEQHELDALYRRARVYVQPSAHEGFGLSVAEGMLAGCVPVVTAAGALPEVVGDTGVVVAERSGPAVAQGIQAALALDPGAGARARARAVREFPLERRVAAVQRLVAETLESR